MPSHLGLGCRALWFTFVMAAPLASLATPPQVNYRPIAFSGFNIPPQYGPNLGYDAVFNEFTDLFALISPGSPSINQHGDVAFRAVARRVPPNPGEFAQLGIWTNHGGMLHPAAYGGSDNFGPNLGPGVWFGGFYDPFININNRGDVAYSGIPYGPNVSFLNMDGLWSTNGSIITPIVSVEPRTQNPLSDLPAHTRFLPTTLAQNNHGEVAFLGSLIDYGATTDNEFAVFTNRGGSLRIVAREGSNIQNPLLGPGIQFDDPRVAVSTTPAISDNGTILFHGGLRGPDIDASNAGALWLDRGNGLELIARSGPTGPGPNLGSIPFATFDSYTLNAHDDVAILARLAELGAPFGYSAGIWMKDNGSGPLELVARTGVPGFTANLDPAVSFTQIFAPVLNASGAIAFSGIAQGPGINGPFGHGIWTNAGGQLRAVALGHAAVPELDTGLGGGIYFSTLSTPAFNNAGDIIFHAYLDGPDVTGLNDQSIWLWSRGQLQMLFREGELFDVNPDSQVTDLHQISSMSIAIGSGGEDGRIYGLNDRGQFAVVMSFQDRLTGIFVGAVVPEPSTAWPFFITLSLLCAFIRVRGETASQAERKS